MATITRQVRDIHQAFHYRQTDTIKAMLAETPTLIDEVDAGGRTLLHRAVWWGELDLVALLLEHGARADIPNRSGYTAINIAVDGSVKNAHHRHIICLLAAHGTNAFAPARNGRCLATIGIQYQDAELIRAIFTHHPTEANRASCNSKFPLSLAIESRSPEIVAVLCNECGTDPNVRDNEGHTALHLLTKHPHLEVARTLISAGADVNAVNTRGETPLHRITRDEVDANLGRLLVEAGANVQARTNLGQTPLHYVACKNVGTAVAKLLLDKGADVDARTDTGDTPMMHAAYFCQAEAVRYLISQGANVHAVDASGNTALHRAAINNGFEGARILVEAGGDPDTTNHIGVSAIHAAIDNVAEIDMVKYLLSNSKRYSTCNIAKMTWSDIDKILLDEIEANPHHLKEGECLNCRVVRPFR